MPIQNQTLFFFLGRTSTNGRVDVTAKAANTGIEVCRNSYTLPNSPQRGSVNKEPEIEV